MRSAGTLAEVGAGRVISFIVRLEIRFEPGAQSGAPAKFIGAAPALRNTRWENHVVTGAPGSGGAASERMKARI